MAATDIRKLKCEYCGRRGYQLTRGVCACGTGVNGGRSACARCRRRSRCPDCGAETWDGKRCISCSQRVRFHQKCALDALRVLVITEPTLNLREAGARVGVSGERV